MICRPFLLTAAITLLPAWVCAAEVPASPSTGGPQFRKPAVSLTDAVSETPLETQLETPRQTPEPESPLPAPKPESDSKTSKILTRVQRPLSQVDTQTAPRLTPPPQSFPEGTAKLPLPQTGPGAVAVLFPWLASGLYHGPLYFEEIGPERYGVSAGCVLQPVLSAGHFVGSTVTLPVQLVVEPPCQCQYALGDLRPGSPLPGCGRPRCGGLSDPGQTFDAGSEWPAAEPTGKPRGRAPRICCP